MGWGTPKRAAPQPVAGKRELLDTETVARDKPSKSDKPSDTDRDEKPSAAIQAELEWSRVRARKGWVPESVAIILYEFIKSQGLFPQLLAFVKGRK